MGDNDVSSANSNNIIYCTLQDGGQVYKSQDQLSSQEMGVSEEAKKGIAEIVAGWVIENWKKHPGNASRSLPPVACKLNGKEFPDVKPVESVTPKVTTPPQPGTPPVQVSYDPSYNHQLSILAKVLVSTGLVSQGLDVGGMLGMRYSLKNERGSLVFDFGALLYRGVKDATWTFDGNSERAQFSGGGTFRVKGEARPIKQVGIFVLSNTDAFARELVHKGLPTELRPQLVQKSAVGIDVDIIPDRLSAAALVGSILATNIEQDRHTATGLLAGLVVSVKPHKTFEFTLGAEAAYMEKYLTLMAFLELAVHVYGSRKNNVAPASRNQSATPKSPTPETPKPAAKPVEKPVVPPAAPEKPKEAAPKPPSVEAKKPQPQAQKPKAPPQQPSPPKAPVPPTPPKPDVRAVEDF